MVCSEGHSDWVSTTNGACFATLHGTFQSCFCPVSTCVKGTDGYYGCEFTYLSYAIIWLLALTLIGLTVGYFRYSRKVSAEAQKRVPAVVDWKEYNDRMFGVYHTAGDEGEGSHPNSNANSARREAISGDKNNSASADNSAKDGERSSLLSNRKAAGDGAGSYGSTAPKR